MKLCLFPLKAVDAFFEISVREFWLFVVGMKYNVWLKHSLLIPSFKFQTLVEFIYCIAKFIKSEEQEEKDEEELEEYVSTPLENAEMIRWSGTILPRAFQKWSAQ